MKTPKYDTWKEMIQSWADEYKEFNEFSGDLRHEMLKEQLAWWGLVLMVVALLTIIIVK